MKTQRSSSWPRFTTHSRSVVRRLLRCSVRIAIAGCALLGAIDAAALPGPGTLTTTLSPAGTITTGTVVTVTLRMANYTAFQPIDGVWVAVEFTPEVYEYVEGSIVLNDLPGPDENWLRKPDQDEVGPAPILHDSTFLAGNCVVVDLRDERSTPGGTVASAGFLISFQMRAIREGLGEFRPANPVLWSSSGGSAGSPSALGASNLVTVASAPRITQQPVSQFLPAGSTARLSVTATGTAPLAYQWRRSGQPIANGGRISGATTRQLTITNLLLADAGSYTVLISNIAGTIVSTPAQLIVTMPPSIQSQPTSVTVVTGQLARFTATATGVPAPAYQWRKDGVNLINGGRISGATSPSLTIANAQLADAAQYRVVVTNVAGTNTSAEAQLTVVVPPFITAQPASLIVSPGGTAHFQVSATGTTPAFQWRRNGVPLLNDERVLGAQTPILALANVQLGDAGDFDCAVANFGGAITSLLARLEVCTAPILVTNPISQVAPLLTTVGFSVLAVGSPTPSLQWFHNDEPIPGATNSLLLLSNVHRANVGLYHAVAANPCGRVSSAVAELQLCVTLAGPILQGIIATDRLIGEAGGGGGGFPGGRLASAIPTLPFHGVPLLYTTYGATGTVACGAVTGSHCKYVRYSHARSNQLVTATAHAADFPTVLVVTDRSTNRNVIACASANGPDGRSSTVQFPAVWVNSYNVWAGGVGTNRGAIRIQIGDAFQLEQLANGAFTFEVAGDVSSREVGFTYTVMTTGRVEAATMTWPQVVTVFPLTNDWVFAFTNPTPRVELARVYGLRGITNIPPVLGVLPFGKCLTNTNPALPKCGCSSAFLPRQ